MFGYIQASKGELRVKEYEMYKAVYCSLCRTLGKEYGFFTRFTLSYDFTFLALLQLALKEGNCSTERRACVCNPLKRCNFIKGYDDFSYSCATAVIMLYHKISDDIADEKGIKKLLARFLRMFFSSAYKKASKKYPLVSDILARYISAQHKAETENTATLDSAAEPTSRALSGIFEMCSENIAAKRILSYLGSLLGRYIYLLDCACDCEEDAKRNRFNPLGKISKKEAAKRIEPQIYIIIDEAIKTFELLDIKRFKNIIGNIIYVGLEDTMKKELFE